MQHHNFAAKALLAVALAAGAATPVFAESTVNAATNTASSAWQEAKTKFFDAFSKQTVTVGFKAGSAAVDEGELSDLKALVASNQRDRKIAAIVVAAWADKDYPTTAGARLGDAERKLADARAARVKAVLKKLGASNVTTYSMAEQPTWLGKAFNLSDAKLKGQGTTKDAEDAYIAEVGKKLRDKGGPGKAVVYVRPVGETATH